MYTSTPGILDHDNIQPCINKIIRVKYVQAASSSQLLSIRLGFCDKRARSEHLIIFDTERLVTLNTERSCALYGWSQDSNSSGGMCSVDSNVYCL